MYTQIVELFPALKEAREVQATKLAATRRKELKELALLADLDEQAKDGRRKKC